jgi:DUF4097 and DUF4098 domain-containing protein YvlB
MNPNVRSESFATPSPVRVIVEVPKGTIRIAARDVTETRVTLTAPRGDARSQQWIAEAEVRRAGDEIVVRIRRPEFSWRSMWSGKVEATIEVPLQSAAVLSTGSGRIETEGKLGDVEASTGSGNIQLDESADVRARTGSGEIVVAGSSASVSAKTGSGDVRIGKVAADVRVATGSGHAELTEALGAAKLTTASGNIDIAHAGNRLEAFAVSGDVRIGCADHGRVNARTVSGGISVGVAKGTAALLDVTAVSGRVRSDLEASDEPGDDAPQVELVLHTMSGNVSVARA